MVTLNQTLINRVASLTIFFWIIKILSTTVGETAADFLAEDMKIGLIHTTILMGIVMIIAVILNFNQKKYFAPFYWFLVIIMSIEGTLITDVLVDYLGVYLITLDLLFILMMFIGFYIWYEDEGTLSIHKITNNKREIFYWLYISQHSSTCFTPNLPLFQRSNKLVKL